MNATFILFALFAGVSALGLHVGENEVTAQESLLATVSALGQHVGENKVTVAQASSMSSSSSASTPAPITASFHASSLPWLSPRADYNNGRDEYGGKDYYNVQAGVLDYADTCKWRFSEDLVTLAGSHYGEADRRYYEVQLSSTAEVAEVKMKGPDTLKIRYTGYAEPTSAWYPSKNRIYVCTSAVGTGTAATTAGCSECSGMRQETTDMEWSQICSNLHGGFVRIEWDAGRGNVHFCRIQVLGSVDSASAAKGDPHLMNLKGEAFDVMQTGNMMLLQIPRGSSPATLDLALHADIERLGVVSCGPTFITSASMTGRWVGVPLEIRSGPIAQNDRHQPKHPFAIRFEGKDWLPHAEMQRTVELSENATITAQDRVFLFHVHGLDIAVSQPKRPRIFLDIQVKGLGNLKTEIGGLLGIDDHHSVEELPAGCETSASSLSLAAMEEDEALQWSARALL